MHSPSFNRYSSGSLEDIAARVVAEFSDHLYDDDDDNVYYLNDQEEEETQPQHQQNNNNKNNKFEEEEEEEEEKEFEFPSLFDRHVAPTEPFPIFGRDSIEREVAARSPLWKLMREERETSAASCSSSSETDDLDGVPEDSYCVWSPAPAKSSSAGASKRWKIKDLLLFRSNSDGKGNFVFLSNHMGGGGKIS